MSFIKLLIPIFFCTSVNMWSIEDKKRDAQIILDELFEVVGNKQLEKPQIKISSSTNSVASYSPYLNTIVIEEKAFDACAILGDQKMDALAFIIGHELGHGYQSSLSGHKHETNFLSYNKCDHSTKSDEENADLFGCFTAYLAGYEIDEVVGETLNSVYSLYELKGKVLSNYPTLDERILSSNVIMEKVEELILLYELAPSLDLAGMHSISKSCYTRITNFYQGKEIYNNLGISYILEAINLSETNIDRYVYPFEFDAESRLKRPFGDIGGKNLDYQDQIVREVLLTKAIKQFSIAIKLDPNYNMAYSNRIIALSILGDNVQLDKRIKEIENSGDLNKSSLIKLAISLAQLKTGNQETQLIAQKNLSKLMNDSSKSISQYAALNLAIFQDEYINYNGTCHCQDEEFPSILSALMKLGKSNEFLELDESTNLEVANVIKKNSFGISRVVKFQHGGQESFFGVSENTAETLCPLVKGQVCKIKKSKKLILDPIKKSIIYCSN